jgi:B12-binding domain/radical SAM domain protein
MNPSHQHPVAALFRWQRLNRYSFLALAASVETFPSLDPIPIVWVSGTNVEDLFHALAQTFHRARKILVAYSIMTQQWDKVRREVQAIGSHPNRGRIFLVAGGPHATGDPKNTLREGFDAVCTGEGEETFPQLLLSLQSDASPDHVKGLYFWKGGRIHRSGREPIPAWEHSPALPYRMAKFGPIEISRGCPFGCKYCQTPFLKGKIMRHRSLEPILEAIDHMTRHGKKDLRFITPNALAYGSPDGLSCSQEALERLLNSVRTALPGNGRVFFGSFPSEVRPEFVTHENIRLIHELCHNMQIVLGAQSGDRQMLEAMRRRHDVEAVARACEIISSEGLTPIVDFMLGLPSERTDQMLATLAFMERLTRLGARVHLHHFMPLPGTPWASRSPTPLPAAVRREVERFIAAGKLFGQWKAQGGRP